MNYIKISLPVPLDFPDEWYDYGNSAHFWMTWRLKVFQKLLDDLGVPTQKPLRVLEAGCGRGILRSEIERITQWTVDGADINETALRRAVPGRGRTLLYNLYDRNPDFHDTFDGIVLFDVVEHVQEPEQFLEAASWHLKPGGWLAINVPALMALYSRYDEIEGHFRRYDTRSARDLLRRVSPTLDPIEMRYWGFLLLPIACLRKFVCAAVSRDKIVKVGFNPPSQWMNRALLQLMRLEELCCRRPPLGTSLMVFARKTR